MPVPLEGNCALAGREARPFLVRPIQLTKEVKPAVRPIRSGFVERLAATWENRVEQNKAAVLVRLGNPDFIDRRHCRATGRVILFVVPMIQRSALLFLASVWTGGLEFQAQAVAVGATLAQPNSLSFVLTLAQPSYGVNAMVPLAYRITNTGSTSMYVPRPFESTACLESGPPRIQAWFASGEEHFRPGYGRSCPETPGAPTPSFIERLAKVAVLLGRGEYIDGVLHVEPRTSSGALKPGQYSIEALLRGWREEQLSRSALADLKTIGAPLLGGELSASLAVTLTP